MIRTSPNTIPGGYERRVPGETLEQWADRRARYLVSLTVGNMALEDAVLDRPTIDLLYERNRQRLLRS